jgi:hypothetical protein
MDIYVVIENGEAYPDPYKTYKEAVDAVKQKHADELDNECNEVDVEEKAITYLYIEKGIHIYIHRYQF